MAQYIKQGNIFGRIGTGIGKGLAEQVPKEIEHQRFRSGLQNLAKKSGQLSPMEAFLEASGTYGATPQFIQSFGELAKQQAKGQALNEFRNKESQNNNAPPFPSLPSKENQTPTSGLTTRPGIEATRKGYIPPTYQQIIARAGELYDQNPALYENNPQKAIEAANQEAQQNQHINQGYQNQRAGEQNIQRAVQSNLQTQADLLKAKVPPNVYSEIEQKAVKSVLPVEEGGEGLTDEEAKIKYGKELDKRSRQYSNLRAIGNASILFQKPSEVLRNFASIRESFKESGDLQNLADTLVSENGLSNSKAYYVTFKNSDIPELDKYLKLLPDVNTEFTTRKGYPEVIKTEYKPEGILHEVKDKLAKRMGKEGSPLAIAEELQSKGYDPSIFLDYLDENRKKLDLTQRQIDELGKPRNFFPTLNDIWLFKKIKQDKLVD